MSTVRIPAGTVTLRHEVLRIHEICCWRWRRGGTLSSSFLRQDMEVVCCSVVVPIPSMYKRGSRLYSLSWSMGSGIQDMMCRCLVFGADVAQPLWAVLSGMAQQGLYFSFGLASNSHLCLSGSPRSFHPSFARQRYVRTIPWNGLEGI